MYSPDFSTVEPRVSGAPLIGAVGWKFVILQLKSTPRIGAAFAYRGTSNRFVSLSLLLKLDCCVFVCLFVCPVCIKVLGE